MNDLVHLSSGFVYLFACLLGGCFSLFFVREVSIEFLLGFTPRKQHVRACVRTVLNVYWNLKWLATILLGFALLWFLCFRFSFSFFSTGTFFYSISSFFFFLFTFDTLYRHHCHRSFFSLLLLLLLLLLFQHSPTLCMCLRVCVLFFFLCHYFHLFLIQNIVFPCSYFMCSTEFYCAYAHSTYVCRNACCFGLVGVFAISFMHDTNTHTHTVSHTQINEWNIPLYSFTFPTWHLRMTHKTFYM